MAAMKQYQIDVSQAVSQEVATVFANAARMVNTQTMLLEYAFVNGWTFWQSGTRWYIEPADDDGYHKNAKSFMTWEQCLAFLLEQVSADD
jgi:hypothetical protein